MTLRGGHVPAGSNILTPSLTVRGADRAIEFYRDAFGAVVLPVRLADPNGKVLFAEIEIGGSRLMITDEFPDMGNVGPQMLGGSPVRLVVYVPDVDAVMERAAAAGATILVPPADQFYGDRSGRLRDPFGHLWIVQTHREDVSAEDMQKRMSVAS